MKHKIQFRKKYMVKLLTFSEENEQKLQTISDDLQNCNIPGSYVRKNPAESRVEGECKKFYP